ncbi:hypothetical protein BU17DRAFT_88617 [Hysterangium stoloniferum]|nr:hypothetical protein BU17DRAFT_88617 [Hysterangium stoloniferum]
MFSIYSTVSIALADANAAFANPVNTHELTARPPFSGTATYWFQKGIADACGQVYSDSDDIVALQTETYANGTRCGGSITVADTNTSVTAMGIVADACQSCNWLGSIDLSRGLF